MASNITATIKLEPYLKKYVILELSSNQDEPTILRKNGDIINFIMPLLISKREHDHKIIAENQPENFMLAQLNIVLPWRKGKIDIRFKNHLGPKAQSLIRDYLKTSFYHFAFHHCINQYLEKRTSTHQTIFDLAEKYDFIEEPHYDTVKRNIYRLMDSGLVPFA